MNFGQLEAFLAKHHCIRSDKRTAFQSRIKNLHRLGYPGDLEAKKGQTTFYSAMQMMKVAVALEVLQFGITPDKCVEFLKTNSSQVALGLAQSAWEARRVKTVQRPSGKDLFLVFDPLALHDMVDLDQLNVIPSLGRAPKSNQPKIMRNRAYPGALFLSRGSGLRETIEYLNYSATYRAALINLSAIVDMFAPIDVVPEERDLFLKEASAVYEEALEAANDVDPQA